MGNTKSTPEAPPIAYFRMCQDTGARKSYRVENARHFQTQGISDATKKGYSVVESVAMKNEATQIAEMLAPRAVAFSPKLMIPKGSTVKENVPIKVEHMVTMEKGGDLLKGVYVIQYRLMA